MKCFYNKGLVLFWHSLSEFSEAVTSKHKDGVLFLFEMAACFAALRSNIITCLAANLGEAISSQLKVFFLTTLFLKFDDTNGISTLERNGFISFSSVSWHCIADVLDKRGSHETISGCWALKEVVVKQLSREGRTAKQRAKWKANGGTTITTRRF